MVKSGSECRTAYLQSHLASSYVLRLPNLRSKFYGTQMSPHHVPVVWQQTVLKGRGRKYMCWPIGISLVSFPAAINSQVEIDAQLAEASPQWKFWTCGEHSADYWAVVISQLQTHPSNFVCGVGTESLKTTFLLCRLFPHSFCQYGVLEWGCRAGGGIPDMPFLFTSFPESITSAVALHPGEVFVFSSWVWFLTFPQHAPSGAWFSVGDCPPP